MFDEITCCIKQLMLLLPAVSFSPYLLHKVPRISPMFQTYLLYNFLHPCVYFQITQFGLQFDLIV